MLQPRSDYVGLNEISLDSRKSISVSLGGKIIILLDRHIRVNAMTPIYERRILNFDEI